MTFRKLDYGHLIIARNGEQVTQLHDLTSLFRHQLSHCPKWGEQNCAESGGHGQTISITLCLGPREYSLWGSWWDSSNIVCVSSECSCLRSSRHGLIILTSSRASICIHVVSASWALCNSVTFSNGGSIPVWRNTLVAWMGVLYWQ